MDDDELDRKLRSIGKECFVTFFGELCDFELSNEAVARYIAEDWGRDESAALTWRVNPSRNIINAGRAEDALIICSKSRLPTPIKEKAAALAARLRKSGRPCTEQQI